MPSPHPSDKAEPGNGDTLAEARRVLEVEAGAILSMVERLGESFRQAVDLLATCQGRVVTTGMGKSGIIARKMAATLASTGTPSLFLHPAEAVHGDLGNIVEEDVLVAISHSGETEEIARLLETIKRLGVPLIALTGKHPSTLSHHADAVLDVGVTEEACPMGLAPTASTTAALAMGDALAMSLLRRKGFRPEDFAAVHPGGKLGARLRRVSDLMHAGDSVPRVGLQAAVGEIISEMTSGHLGMTMVLQENGHLAGIVTDGDLRRLLLERLPGEPQDRDILSLTATDFMTAAPRTIAPGALASQALNLMEKHKITCLVVMETGGEPLGVIHLHDLWRTELI